MGVDEILAATHRDEWGRIVATLLRLTGDLDLAEECAQDAFARALERWPADGVPDRPGAWLTATARNRAVDRLRQDAAEQRRLLRATREPAPQPAPAADFPDDRLQLMFLCCHPALSREAQVALTLRSLAGLGTAEIARAFLVPEATMAQRLVRAKNKIRYAAIPPVTAEHLRPERTVAVEAVLYLIFTAAFPDRHALADEAIRLARVLVTLTPGDPEPEGLLALMLLHDARRAARTDAAGDLIPLPDQDRTAWDAARTAEGLAVLDTALARRSPGPYQVQAAIAACHATADSAATTDWEQIARLYEHLEQTPVVRLNRAVAVAEWKGPAVALALVDDLDLPGYHLLPATRAELLRRLGRTREAKAAYALARELAPTEAERRFLQRRADDL
ncbi:RNA polymerase sigma factor [Spirilliplanes yamanashiensis]|uniref:RNA polymerase subunit sigma-24 n=1 Tax=Spirilliplanes yamanashiensis TaxID=42233 RepID=A0A8J3Y8S4_9ACTN|nr:sigma-70 family RNA polymerase sigma factor [Spirilliplanes yamanashiensis]MDP9816981.1 RNA polymerase sigma-70 factor (ECF subfamily) [Spirilliplanes yamanashiensis]GIJ03362.1 RNA polymerase subunit sigma-24 [Spirilliplanes yamanashiensis]